MTIPPSFFFWVFLPGCGVVKAVCEPTTTDAEAAEVDRAVLAENDKHPLCPAYTADEQRRIDEAAADAVAFFQAGHSEDEVEAATLDCAEAVEHRHLSNRYTHPDDRTLPAWQE